jgi:hypothetical protein
MLEDFVKFGIVPGRINLAISGALIALDRILSLSTNI